MLRYDVKVDPRDAVVPREKRHLDQLLSWSDDENVLVLEPVTERVLHLRLAALHLCQHLAGLTGDVLAFALPEREELPYPAKRSKAAVAVGSRTRAAFTTRPGPDLSPSCNP